MLRFYDQKLDAPSRLHVGTHRAASLAQTWRRFAPAMKRAGITRIADLTGLDDLGIPVHAAIRPFGKSLSTQQGKGLSHEAARVSALMESLETWTAEELAIPKLRGSANKLAKKHDIVAIEALPRTRKKLDHDATWDWVEGFDLVAGKPVLVPAQAVTLDTTQVDLPKSPMIFDVSSNGLASGNVLVEAIVHGLAEVIERDAEAAWRRAGGDRRLVLDTLTDPACTELVSRITRRGSRVFVWDLTSEIGLCTIGCAIVEDPREPKWRPLGCYQGFGSHLVAEVAIARAITEAVQTRLTYIAGGRDDFFAVDYERATDPEILTDLWAQLAQPCDEPVMLDDLPSYAPRSLGEALELQVELAVAAGCEQIIVIELTHPELGVPVVKVIVPGRATDVEALG